MERFLILSDYDADEIRLLAMKFKKDIKDNDWREPNGQSITDSCLLKL